MRRWRRCRSFEAALGLEANVGPASKPVSDRLYRALRFTPDGVGLRPFSVGHVEQPWRTARTPGDLVIRWTPPLVGARCRQLRSARGAAGGESEAFDVEIHDGATVKRTLRTTTTSVTYTAAQQVADWGALLGPGGTLDVRIYQLSALVGRGTAKTRHLAALKALHARHQHPPPAAVPAREPGARVGRHRRGSPIPRLGRHGMDGRRPAGLFSNAVFHLVSDPTRRAIFDPAAIAAGVTRSFALPDVSGAGEHAGGLRGVPA